MAAKGCPCHLVCDRILTFLAARMNVRFFCRLETRSMMLKPQVSCCGRAQQESRIYILGSKPTFAAVESAPCCRTSAFSYSEPILRNCSEGPVSASIEMTLLSSIDLIRFVNVSPRAFQIPEPATNKNGATSLPRHSQNDARPISPQSGHPHLSTQENRQYW